MTLLFYLFIDFIAVMLITYAGKMEQPYRLNGESGMVLNKKKSFVIYVTKVDLFFLLSFLTLFLVLVFRDESVGHDYAPYLNTYKKIGEGEIFTASEEERLGLVFIYLCKFFYLFFENGIFLFSVLGFLTIFFLYKSIRHISCDWGFSLYIFISFCLYYQTFNQFRQMLALTIVTYALRYVNESKLLKFLFFVLLATAAHTSSVCVVVLYFVSRFAINWKIVVVYFIATVVGYIGFDRIIYFLSMTNYGSIYLHWDEFNSSFDMSTIINLIVRLLMLVFCLLFSKNTIKRNPKTNVMYHAIIICTILQIFTLQFRMFARLTTYFFVPYIFLIPEVMLTFEQKLSKKSCFLVKCVIYVVLFAYHIVYYFSASGAVGSGYDEYKSLLF